MRAAIFAIAISLVEVAEAIRGKESPKEVVNMMFGMFLLFLLADIVDLLGR